MYKLLPVEPGQGLVALPAPSDGDLFRNCGLDRAVRLAEPTLWKEALDRCELYGDYDVEED